MIHGLLTNQAVYCMGSNSLDHVAVISNNINQKSRFILNSMQKLIENNTLIINGKKKDI